jgi:hypothetical protein
LELSARRRDEQALGEARATGPISDDFPMMNGCWPATIDLARPLKPELSGFAG